jgi:hypothetical protein
MHNILCIVYKLFGKLQKYFNQNAGCRYPMTCVHHYQNRQGLVPVQKRSGRVPGGALHHITPTLFLIPRPIYDDAG